MRTRRKILRSEPGNGVKPRLPVTNQTRPGLDPLRLPTLVCFPRVVRRPVLGLGWITSGMLARHLEALSEAGFGAVDLNRFLEPPESPGQGEVVVAFHDADAEFVEHAWPVLQEFGVAPTLFVRTADLGRSRRSLLPRSATPGLTWSDLRHLSHEGASVQSAGHHGIDAERVPAEMVFGDLIRSRREMGNRLGREPQALAYPFDRAGARARQLAAQAGFELGFASGLKPPYESLLGLGQLSVGTFWKPATLLRRLPPRAKAMGA